MTSKSNDAALRHEALDRIHVIQTIMSAILYYDGDLPHDGLCDEAHYRLEKALDELAEAYRKQSEYLFALS